MKGRIKKDCKSLFLVFLMGILSIAAVSAQSGSTIRGHIKDAQGEAIIGASVVVKGTTTGTVTDIDGNFVITAAPENTLVITYIGYKPQDVLVGNQTTLNITLQDDAELLSEVVVIGYGSVKKDDLTGSVVAIKVDEMNKGLTTSPQDLLGGKIPGVSVISSGGQPGTSSTIRIRGGSSLNASNDPLIVVDGVILSNEEVDGFSNGLSSINPADIETFTVLKDASATAIYGSRASNGVILITTKKGTSDKVRITYNGNITISTPRKKVEMLSGNEYRNLITNLPDATSSMLDALDLYDASTDWQDEIYRTAVSTDHNLSVYGSVKDYMPYRASLGYTTENGTLDTSNFQRYTGNISLTPSLFDNHLKMNLNAKGTYIKNRFGNTDAVGGAIFFDPTKPVTNGNTNYGGYYTWTTDGQPDGPKIGSSGANPVSQLKMTEDKSNVKSLVAAAQFDYKLHFFPDIKLNMNLSYDYTNSDGGNYIYPNAPSNYGDIDKSGSRSHYENTYINRLFEFYAQYSKELEPLQSKFDVMGGYSYQSYTKGGNSVTHYLSRDPERWGQETEESSAYKEYGTEKYVLLSFFGRFNYTMMDKYLLTFTLRDDASSRFSKSNRWGLFPSLALAWRINDEEFMKGFDALSSLKLRLGWGKTGQQDVGGYYPSSSSYSWGKGGTMFPYYDAQGNVTWVNVIKPTAVNPDLKWEETTTWNAGLDYGFLNNRISGAVDVYYRKTTNLLNKSVNIAAGTDFAELIEANIGTLVNKGIEFSIDASPIVTKDFSWDLGYNISYNHSEITELTFNDAMSSSPGYRFESTGGDGGKTIKIHSVGYAPGAFYVYEQIYDEAGKPIEGAYVDQNNDGIIDDNDLRQYKKPDADIIMGFNSKFRYQNWDLGFNGRVSLGNYIYNAFEANNASLSASDIFSNNVLTNRSPEAVETGFSTRQRLSDYYVRNASFLKIDNITLGYSIPKYKARVYGTVQNPIIISKFKGIDPETTNGMYNDLYPRPLSFIFGVNLNF